MANPPGQSVARQKVVFALVSGRIAGGQKIALVVARRLVEMDHAVAAVAPDEGATLDKFRNLGAEIRVISPPRSFSLMAANRLASWLRSSGATCLYTHTVPSHETMLAAAAARARTPLVVHRHGPAVFSGKRLRRYYQRVAWRAALRSAADVVAVAPHVAAEVESASGREAAVVFNGVPLPKLSAGSHNAAPVVGFVGRIDPNKRLEDFLMMAVMLSREHRAVRFLVVGATGYPGNEQYCSDLIGRLGLEGVTTLIFSDSDGSEHLRDMDVFVVPSRLEGHPLVLLEAMALGKPVVATDIPGCKDTVRDGIDGLLVPVEDPSALAASAARFLTSRDEAHRMGSAARARVAAEFSEESMLARLIPLVLRT